MKRKDSQNSLQKVNTAGKIKNASIGPGSAFPVLPLILVLTFLVFSNSITKIFIALDDQVYIQDNPFIKSLSWDSIVKMFTSFYNGNYHPFTTLLYAFENVSFGDHAFSFHVISLLFHLLNVILAYYFFIKLTSRREIAIIGSLIFAIHPMHAESVVWISEQKDVLYTFFYLAGLISYVNYVKEKKNKELFKTILFFLFSLLSKSAAVTFPLVLFCIDYYMGRTWNRKIFLEKIPFFLLSLLFGVLAIMSQNAAGAINDETMVPYTAFQRIFVVSYALVYYIIKFIIPYDLCVLHYAPEELSLFFYLCPFVLIGLTWLAYKGGQMRKALVSGLLFYLFSVILVAQIIPIGYVIVSERYSYVPYLGLALIIGNLYVLVKDGKWKFGQKLKPYLIYIILIPVLMFSYLTYDYNKRWHSSVILFADIVKRNPASGYAYYNYGKIQNVHGDPDGAVKSYFRAIELDSTIAEVYFCRATIYFSQKKYEPAIKDYLKAEELKPIYIENLNNLAFLYSEIGKMDESIEYYGKAIAINPSEYLYQRRATCFTFQKNYKDALTDYAKAIEINPNLSEAYFNRGVCYYYTQHLDSACIDWKKSAAMGYATAKGYSEKYCKN